MGTNNINNIQISNFKSIKNLKVENCKRINLFVGTPNAGKSNLLEAISTLMVLNAKSKFKFNELVRWKNATELFNYGNIKSPVTISIDGETSLSIVYSSDAALNFDYFQTPNFSLQTQVAIEGIAGSASNKPEYLCNHIFKYQFDKGCQFNSKENASDLTAFNGNNLFWVIENNNDLKEFFFDIIKEFGLKFYNQQPQNSVVIFKELSQFNIFPFSFELLPDTVQRLLFYHTAIATNTDNILLFEEPEAHMFPPYISKFTNDVVESKSNQFFIATHSPYVINDFLDSSIEELAIHELYFDDGETKCYTLSKENLDTIYQMGAESIFLNLERFRENAG